MRTLRILCLGAALLATEHTWAANLLQNGSFELPGFAEPVYYVTSTNNNLTGWFVPSPSSRNVAVHKTPEVGSLLGSEFNFAQQGSYYLDLSGSRTNHPTVSQSFVTWQGFSYNISFYYGAATNSPSPTINVQIFDERPNLNVTLTPAAATNGSISWTRYEFTWVAHANSTVLRFQDVSNSDDNSSFIDNVTVLPYPSELKPFRILSVRFGQGGWLDPYGWTITWQSAPSFTYQVLYKDSMADPVWTPLTPPFVPTPSPDPNTASFTDTTAGGLTQRYYQVIGQ